MAVPTPHIDLVAGVGITAGGDGQITSWVNPGSFGGVVTGASDAVGDALRKPVDTVDEFGNKIVRLPFGYTTTAHKAYFTMPVEYILSSSRAYTILAVVRLNNFNGNQSLMAFTGFLVGLLKWYNTGTTAPHLLMGSFTSTIKINVPVNRIAIGARSGATAHMWLNDVTQQTTSPVALDTSGNAGGFIGLGAAGEYMIGDIYRLRYWNQLLTQPEYDEALAQDYATYFTPDGIPTAYTKRLVIWGDSRIHGVNSTLGRNVPRHAHPPDWECFNAGIGGQLFGVDGASGLRGTRSTWIDPLYDSTKALNHLQISALGNDISSDAITGAQALTRLTDGIAEAKAAKAWDKVLPHTLPERLPEEDNYNIALRAAEGTLGIDDVIDCGYRGDDPLGRLDDNTVDLYYDDEFGVNDSAHPNGNGQFVMACHSRRYYSNAPLAPTFPTLGTVTANSVQISWTDASDDEGGFRIDRRLQAAGSAWSTVDTVLADVTNYTDTTPAPLTAYYYRVLAFNGGASSNWDIIVAATTEAAVGGGLAPIVFDAAWGFGF